ncbi:MAG: hypothetical protein OSB25_11770 [Salibacteraceae bacterium]|nr:hypothetical protein [Salibacteraceae bacterium]
MRKIQIVLGLSFLLFCLIKIIAPEPIKNKELVQEFWIQKTHANSNFNAVIGGDSRVYRGFSPEDFNDASVTDLLSINLGYSSTGFSSDYLDFCLSKFDVNSKKNVLILGITPHSLTKEAFKNEASNKFAIASTFEVFRYKYLSSFLKYLSPYSPSELFNEKTDNYKEKHEKNGWISSYYLEPDSSRALKNYTKTFLKYQVTDNEINAFLNKVKEIRTQDISIIAFRPPSSIAMRNLEDSISGFDEEYIKRELEDMGVQWLDFREGDFNSYDGSHLHFESAKKLSILLGIEVSKLFENQTSEVSQNNNY